MRACLHQRIKKHNPKRIDFNLDLDDVYKKYRGKCQGCGCNTVRGRHPQVPESATMEHLIPLSQGGNHVWSNVTLLCMKCNTGRNHRIQIAKPKWVKTIVTLFGFTLQITKL